MQRLSQIRKSRKDGSILRDQRSIQLLCCGNELTVVGTALAGAHQLENVLRADGLVVSGKDGFCFLHQRNGSGTLQEIAPEITAEHIAKLAAPQRRRRPFAIQFSQNLSQFRLGTRKQQIGQHVGVDNNHGRPSRLNASIESGSNTWGPRLLRRALSLVSSSSAEGMAVPRPASRQTIASLLRLRRCRLAAAFSRAWSASGRFLRVRVLAIAAGDWPALQPVWIHSGCPRVEVTP